MNSSETQLVILVALSLGTLIAWLILSDPSPLTSTAPGYPAADLNAAIPG